jgi:hypothetical protein
MYVQERHSKGPDSRFNSKHSPDFGILIIDFEKEHAVGKIRKSMPPPLASAI